jgi:hypothetical protein
MALLCHGDVSIFYFGEKVFMKLSFNIAFVLALFLVISSVSSADERCGEFNQITIPAYQFAVTDNSGQPLEVNSKFTATIGRTNGSRFDIVKEIPIKVDYDTNQQLYVSRPVTISLDEKFQWFNWKCNDRLLWLMADFNDGSAKANRIMNLQSGLLSIDVPNVVQPNLADSAEVRKVTLDKRDHITGMIEGEISWNLIPADPKVRRRSAAQFEGQIRLDDGQLHKFNGTFMYLSPAEEEAANMAMNSAHTVTLWGTNSPGIFEVRDALQGIADQP